MDERTAEPTIDEELFRAWTEQGCLSSLEEQHRAFGMRGDTRLAISEQARLRRDRAQVVFYGATFLDVWSRRLNPGLAVVVACLNGSRTLDDVSALLREHCGGSKELNDFKVRKALATVDAFGPAAPGLFSREVYPSRPFRAYNPRDYVIPGAEVRLTAELDAPITMLWMPTDVCQTDCVYCYATRRPVPASARLSDQRVKGLMDEAAAIGVCSVNVDGGDALCRKGITGLLGYAVSKGLSVDLSTKAYVSKSRARELYDAGIRTMQFGFDAPYPELFDRVVGRKGHFRRTLESITNCAEAGIACRTNSILVQDTHSHVRELVALLHTLPLRDMKIASAFRSAHRHREGLLLTEVQKRWLREQVAILQQEYPEGKIKFECRSDYLDMDEGERSAAFRDFPRCGAGRETIIVAPDGRVTMCEQSPQDDEFIVGNVTNCSLVDVWQSETMRRFKEARHADYAGTPCSECEEFDRCQVLKGGCLMLQYKAYGTRFAPHPACPKAPRYEAPLQ